MSGQRYTSPAALAWMAMGLCPECGNPPDAHTTDNRFWMPNVCGFGGLTAQGVVERIQQYRDDLARQPAWERSFAERFDVFPADDDETFDQDDPCLDPNVHAAEGCQTCAQSLFIIRKLAAITPHQAYELSRMQTAIFQAVFRADEGHILTECEAIANTKVAKLWQAEGQQP